MLRAARRVTGLTLTAAGGALKPPVNASYLSEVELGGRPCSAKRLAALAKLYKMDDPTVRALFVAARVLPPKVYQSVLKRPETWAM